MNLVHFIFKKEKIIDSFIKTNRYYDSSLNSSLLKFDDLIIKNFNKNLYQGKATEEIYNNYCQLIKNDEIKLKNYLNLNIYDYKDFTAYIKKLHDSCLLKDGFYVKDKIIIQWIYLIKPIKTIKACKCSNIDELLKKYNCRQIMALTRIFEDSKWHNELFNYLEKQSFDIFEKRKVEIFIFDNDFEFQNNFNKITWDDKICGSIFSVYSQEYISKVPYLRIASEFFHFVFEFEIYSLFIQHILDNEKTLKRFKRFFVNEIECLDIFEPHALSEGIAWQKAIAKLFDFFPFLNDNWNKSKLNIYYNHKYILSNNIIDYIRALSSAKFPNISTVTALFVRLKLLQTIYTDESIEKAIAINLDKGIINIKCLIKKEEL